MKDNRELAQAFDERIPHEDEHTEFKRSIFVGAKDGKVGASQMQTLAKIMAGFMNTGGGTLYVGISDARHVVGMEKDLAILQEHSQDVAVKTPRFVEDGVGVYRADEDSYSRKIRAIAKGYLGDNALELIGDVRMTDFRGEVVCRVCLKACHKGDFVYFYRWEEKNGMPKEYQEVCVRSGSETLTLTGVRRDMFIRERAVEQLLGWKKALAIPVRASVEGKAAVA